MEASSETVTKQRTQVSWKEQGPGDKLLSPPPLTLSKVKLAGNPGELKTEGLTPVTPVTC